MLDLQGEALVTLPAGSSVFDRTGRLVVLLDNLLDWDWYQGSGPQSFGCAVADVDTGRITWLPVTASKIAVLYEGRE